MKSPWLPFAKVGMGELKPQLFSSRTRYEFKARRSLRGQGNSGRFLGRRGPAQSGGAVPEAITGLRDDCGVAVDARALGRAVLLSQRSVRCPRKLAGVGTRETQGVLPQEVAFPTSLA